MPSNDNAVPAPRTCHGFIPGTFAADYFAPNPLPSPPAAWHVLAPADLVPLHKFLVQQATDLAGRGNATQIAKQWSAAAGTIADLRFAWAVRVPDTAAESAMREAAKHAVAATLEGLRHAQPADIQCWRSLAESWTSQLRMSAVPHRQRRFARRLREILAASPRPQDR
ncbi:hypothetical protein L3Q65_00790 (plasmid) [Amycolatopsis sp. FU40]|uniref:hypothetical protein n=1 Tax=Amycolatopsis sp. FU40 TaxID=2914159 RepID=UPI001F16B029|nr:hypothetical protein [Amycolatopsis sp. FU40]UKD50862.1 hypothetical protein L3Q65_00790 [Amycolatopsis sp. FU40]